ncbi:hypothetical protein LCGC14_1468980, partial [marine sediment metagenome]
MISVDTKLGKAFKPRNVIAIINEEFRRGMVEAVAHVEGKVKEKMPVGVTGMA